MTNLPTNTKIEVAFADQPNETWLVNILPDGGVAVSPPPGNPAADFSAVLAFVAEFQNHINTQN